VTSLQRIGRLSSTDRSWHEEAKEDPQPPVRGAASVDSPCCDRQRQRSFHPCLAHPHWRGPGTFVFALRRSGLRNTGNGWLGFGGNGWLC
jgi:hypothetical protein